MREEEGMRMGEEGVGEDVEDIIGVVVTAKIPKLQ